VVAERLAPHLCVAVFNVGKAAEQILACGSRLSLRQHPIQERGVGFVLEVVLPRGNGLGVGRGGRG